MSSRKRPADPVSDGVRGKKARQDPPTSLEDPDLVPTDTDEPTAPAPTPVRRKKARLDPPTSLEDPDLVSTDTDEPAVPAPTAVPAFQRPFLTLFTDDAGRSTLLITQYPTYASVAISRPALAPEGWRRTSAPGIAVREALIGDELDLDLPPVLEPKHPYHACDICKAVKTHPVILLNCGHTFCYLCARIKLQSSWRCHTCHMVIRSPPVQNQDVEDFLGLEYPLLAINKSRVTYSFRGLMFPTASVLPLATTIDTHSLFTCLRVDARNPPIVRGGRRRARSVDVDTAHRLPDDWQQTVSARGFYIAPDGMSKRQQVTEVPFKRVRLNPEHLEDPFATWRPMPSHGDAPAAEGGDEEAAADDDATTGDKRKTRASHTNPNAIWRPLIPEVSG
ncbi:RING-type domain-containing protein [Mycena chlorophos]|uniref:RING-type domain-containing protein n=1 Tax=Mycena chlorophos TaxID=658473 RepID=A0A8H6SKU8_MYCCL|nr:RING-type domain-containing protein [Mycena chlorophos]